ncbi:MAG: UDP-3-O-(3-hydroxymyristoyl)glucosamine N-acyltransferase [Candidatus Omnitrophica bacterium]|nr:UDP-3-O-(3-hydroxymyristoyl)glucosamine N-acyltransferase [Candidatus Omnitrophota bacterium]
MIQRTLLEVATLLGGEVVGDGETVITGVCGIKEAAPGDITFVANSRYLRLMHQTKASAIITGRDVKWAPKPLVRTENPSLAFAKMVSLMAPAEPKRPTGVSPQAIVGQRVTLGRDVAIQAFAVIEDDVTLGDRTVVYAGCYVGHHARIGADCLIYPNVSIRESVELGARVVVHSGTVIGSDGFGFATVKGAHHKIPQIGTVVIEDDVEIGANVTIDRARFGKTVIGRGTKIDNLVQIAHNVEIGENAIIVAQTGISGSTIIGQNVTLAGQAGVVGHITIGDNAIVAAQAGVSKSVPPDTQVWGSPAKPLARAKRINACIQRLPELVKTIEALSRRLEQLEKTRGTAATTDDSTRRRA